MRKKRGRRGRDIQKQHGLPWRCNDSRHTCASRMAERGVSDLVIAKILGNSPEVCRKHCIEISLRSLCAAIDGEPAALQAVSEGPEGPAAANLRLVQGA